MFYAILTHINWDPSHNASFGKSNLTVGQIIQKSVRVNTVGMFNSRQASIADVETLAK